MPKTIAMLLVVFAVAVLTIALTGRAIDHQTRCTEDMPCWNCHTDGNRICGIGHS